MRVVLDTSVLVAAAGRREDFERYLGAVPAAPPLPGDEL